MSIGSRVFNFFNDLDKGVNALGGGEPNQTLSGTFGRGLATHKWWAYIIVPVVNFFAYFITKQKNHCQTAAIKEANG